MAVRSLGSVIAEVVERETTSGVRIVGIDGPSGAGKSTLAKRLSHPSGASLISTDDFASWRNVTNWWPRFEGEVLKPLLAGKDAHFAARDWTNDEFGASTGPVRTVPWAPLVIVEGVTATRSEAGEAITYRIWVDAPEYLRLERGIQRDGSSHHQLWLDWMRVEAAFFTQDRTRDLADLLVVGAPEEPHDADTEVVVAAR